MGKNSVIPPEARAEIEQILRKNNAITTSELLEILQRHKVKGDPSDLQRTYRLRAAQRLMASLKDEKGRRRILAYNDSENNESGYLSVDLCTDVDTLQAIRHRLHSNIAGIQKSSYKLKDRISVVGRLKRLIRF